MRHNLILLLFALAIRLTAQDFTTIPQLKVDSVFVTQIDVAAQHLAQHFEVELCYPEFSPLSSVEAASAEKLEIPRHTMPEVETTLGISRGEGKLLVKFRPIVYRDNKWQRITSCKISIRQPKQVQHVVPQSTSNRYTEQSKLAQGKWYKISVSEEGMYRITPDKLKEMGFADPSTVRIYGYGGLPINEKLPMSGPQRLTDDIEEVAIFRNGDDIVFFAEGVTQWEIKDNNWTHKHNPYSTKSYYFVTEGGTPSTIQQMPTQPQAKEIISTVRHYGLYEKDAFGWYEGGCRLHDDYDFIHGNQHTFRVNTPSPAKDGVPPVLTVAASASHATAQTKFDFSLDKQQVGNMVINTLGNNTVARELRADFTLQAVKPQNDIAITVTPEHHARLNYLRISYDRQLRADDSKTYAFIPKPEGTEPVKLQIQNATSNTHLLMIGRSGEMTQEVPSTLNGDILYADIEDPTRRYVIYDSGTSTLEIPTLEGEIEPQNLHADRDYDMVILVPQSAKYLEQANRLAEFHSNADGMNVKVVRANQIYNEFSSGTPDASAIRRYLKMLYDRGQDGGKRPAYLLLFGPSAWDNRLLTSDWRGHKQEDYLLAYEGDASETSIGDVYSYVSDDYYALMDDGESDVLTAMPDLAVGRLTPYSAAEAQTYVDNIIAYHNNTDTGAWKTTILMMGDYGDNNSHMEDSERIIKAINEATHNTYDIQRVYPDTYKITNSSTGNTYPQANKKIHEILERGALIANYSGHGSPTQLSHANLLKSEDFKTLSPNHMTHWILASCEIYPIDSHKECFGQIAMTTPQGGAIAFMCATRAVYASYNNPLNCAYSALILSNDETGQQMTFGEALRRAKNQQTQQSSSARLNKIKYVIIGDPALRLKHPTAGLSIDTINGKVTSEDEVQELKAGSIATIKGHVDQTDFNGTATLKLFDRNTIVTTQGYDANSPYKYIESGKKIYEGSTFIKDSQFSFTVPIPMDISYTTDQAQLIVYANRQVGDQDAPVTNNSETSIHNEAIGMSKAFCLNGTDDSVEPDTIGPKVLVYLDDISFPDGGIVPPSTTFMADISDERGINASGLSLGHDITLVIDNDETNSIVLNDYFAYDFGSYAKGHISYPLLGLSPGEHKLKFRVWDVNNNATTTNLNFFVTSKYDHNFGITATRNPTRTSTTLIVKLEYSDEPQEVDLSIYDLYGKCVWTKHRTAEARQTNIPCVWNISHDNGSPVEAGLYICRAKVTKADGRQASCDTKIIVTKQ